MDKARYLELEYQTLRKEIEDSLNRSFQIMVGGTTLIPALIGVLAYYAATAILMALPLMVVVIALLYLNQWNSIMRCGRYIRTRIELPIMGSGGWEAWLETHPGSGSGAYDNRLVDSYLVYAFYLLIAAYYFATCYVAIAYAKHAYGGVVGWAGLGVYIPVGVLIGVIVLRRVPTSTTTKHERGALLDAADLVVDPPKESHEDAGTGPFFSARTPFTLDIETSARDSVEAECFLASAVAASRPGIVFDFDGTLAEIAAHPDMARPLDGVTEILDVLVARMELVVVISSRPIESLLRVFPRRPEGLVVIGQNGLERLVDDHVEVRLSALTWRSVVAATLRRARAAVPGGVTVEDKGLAIGLHYRALPDLQLGRMVGVIAKELADATGLRLRPGRQCFSLEIPLDVDKGTVTSDVSHGLDWVAFAGDDHVDLPAFAALDRLRREQANMRTFSIAVRSDESPAELEGRADLVVPGPRGLLELLGLLVARLEDRRR